MSYDDPYNEPPNDEKEQSWCIALIYTIGAILMLILGLLGNGVIGQ